MGSAVVEKTEEELRKEIDELNRQKWQITERLRDPRGLRRGGTSGAGPRNFNANANNRQRGFVRPNFSPLHAERTELEDQSISKKRLSSTVVKPKKIEDGEIVDDEDVKDADFSMEESVDAKQSERKPSNWARRVGEQRHHKMGSEDPPIPRVLPKDEDPTLVKRNKRMFGQLLGTLERFNKEDAKLSSTEAYMRRSDSLRRAEEKAREESERLRQQEREQIAEKRRRDLTLRARVAAKAEEKKLELLFLRWSEHHRKLGNFKRTKAEPPIYYVPNKPLDEDATLVEQRKEQIFQEWKAARREELSEYQKQLSEQIVANVENEMDRWQNAKNTRNANNNALNLQETMDKELETHRLEHGPKRRKIPGGSGNNEDEDDVEDINAGEDDMLDDVLDVDENARRGDDSVKAGAVNNGGPLEENKDE